MRKPQTAVDGTKDVVDAVSIREGALSWVESEDVNMGGPEEECVELGEEIDMVIRETDVDICW